MGVASRHSNRGKLIVGCSGYDYQPWRGIFYPEDLAHDEWFGFYAEHFGALEVNNTFYSLPDQKTVEQWRERAPDGFEYAVKLSRYGTHMKHLKDPDQWIRRFLNAVERLGRHLGPILVQLPPNWDVDLDRLRGFVRAASSDHRWAVECRDQRWLREDVYDILAEANMALVLHDLIDDHPEHLTADWTYIRYHGTSKTRQYAGSYSHQRLTADARKYAHWNEEGRDVYAFFNNDVDGDAPKNAEQLVSYADSTPTGA